MQTFTTTQAFAAYLLALPPGWSRSVCYYLDGVPTCYRSAMTARKRARQAGAALTSRSTITFEDGSTVTVAHLA